MKQYSRLKRLLQRATGVHRIHHIRFGFGFGWRPPLVGWAYFPPWTARDRSGGPKRYAYGWQRVVPAAYHDCTSTGRH